MTICDRKQRRRERGHQNEGRADGHVGDAEKAVTERIYHVEDRIDQ